MTFAKIRCYILCVSGVLINCALYSTMTHKHTLIIHILSNINIMQRESNISNGNMRKAGRQLLLIRTAICSSSAFTHQLQFNSRVLRSPPLLPTQYRHQSATTSLGCNNNNSEVISIMPNGVKKENLPTKVCVVCGRPYTWR